MPPTCTASTITSVEPFASTSKTIPENEWSASFGATPVPTWVGSPTIESAMAASRRSQARLRRSRSSHARVCRRALSLTPSKQTIFGGPRWVRPCRSVTLSFGPGMRAGAIGFREPSASSTVMISVEPRRMPWSRSDPSSKPCSSTESSLAVCRTSAICSGAVPVRSASWRLSTHSGVCRAQLSSISTSSTTTVNRAPRPDMLVGAGRLSVEAASARCGKSSVSNSGLQRGQAASSALRGATAVVVRGPHARSGQHDNP